MFSHHDIALQSIGYCGSLQIREGAEEPALGAELLEGGFVGDEA